MSWPAARASGAPFFDPSLRDVVLSLDDGEVLAGDETVLELVRDAGFADARRWAGGIPPQVRGRLGRERSDRLEGGAAAVRAVPLGSVDPTGLRRVLVATASDELVATERLGATLSGRAVQVLSLKNDVHPAVVSGGVLEDAFEVVHGPLPAAPERSLVIVGVMRSGTYLMAELLREHGLGRPEEHIRGDIAAGLAARSGPKDLSFPHWLARLRLLVEEGGWSSTKIVSHFLERLWSRLTPAEREALADWLGAAVVVRLVRRDKVLQAVSAHRALTTRMYRITTDAQARRYEEMPYEYSFEGIEERLRFVTAQEEFLDEVLRAAGAAPVEVVYEDLAADPDSVARSVVSAAGGIPRLEVAPPADRRMRDGLSEEYAARYRAEAGS